MRQQRQHSPERRSRKFKYSFEAIIDEVRINVKFPCRIAVSWNYGDGEVRTSSSRQLMSGIARFDEKLVFTAVIGFDEETQKYHELKSTVEISIITDNGTSLAGFVPIDLGNIINRKDRKELFEIQRCPDKGATVRMRVSYRFLSDSKPKNRVKLLGNQSGEDSDFEQGNRSVTPRSEYMPKTEYVMKKSVAKDRDPPQHNRNKELIEKELLVLKGRVTEYETKFKNERSEKEKLAELLKGKQEVFFTMKTQIKRKQIQLEDVYRSLEEYRSQYERIKLTEESTRRESDKVVKALQTSERLLHEKIVKLEAETSASERRLQKSSLQVERLKKQKDNLLIFQKERNDETHKEKEALNQSIRVLKRQREESYKQSRIEKESLERNLRQMTKNHKQVSDELELVRNKLGVTEKKMLKFQESRTQEFHKFNSRINELDKVRESLVMENEVLKSSITKKQISWIEAAKSFDARINEEKTISATVKTQLTEVQFDRATLQKDLAIIKQAWRGSDEDCKRLDKQCSILKGQISALTEQLQARNVDIKGLNSKIKDLQEEIQRQTAQLQEAHEDSVNDLSNRLKEVKKSQQSKNAATMKILTRKEKQLEESLLKEQKLLGQVDTLKDQIRKSEQVQKERMDASKKLENNLRQEIQELIKKGEKAEEELMLRLESVSRQLMALEEAFSDQKDILARTTERELKFKHEVQSLSQQLVYADENKQLVAQYEDKLKENDKSIDEMSEDIRNREIKQLQLTKLVTDLKDKLMESDGDRAKKESLIKDKDKLLSTSSKQAALELDEKKRELSRRQTEIKILHDQMRDSLKRQRSKQDELSIENERISNELSVALSNLDNYAKNLEQLQMELKNFRDNERSLLQEKQQLLRSRQDGELYRREVEELRLMMDESLANKDKDLRSLRQQNAQFDRSYTELNKMYIRNNLMVEELVDLANKLSSISISTMSTISVKDMTASMVKSVSLNDYDRLLELRKLLVVAEGRWRKQLQIVSDREHTRIKERQKDQNDIEKLNADVQRYRGEIIRMKKDNQELIYSCDFMKIQNQQLLYKLQGVEGELGSAKNLVSHLESKSKELLHDLERSDADNRQLQTRYEGLLEQVRVTLTDKAQKQKKQLTATIRKHEARIEELEQKTFQLELENQKVGELTKREQQNKKILARIFELERQNMHLTQSSNQKVDKVQNDYEKLLWQKKTLEDNLKNTVVKFERTLANNQQELERANTKTKEVAQQLRDKEIQLNKTEQSLQRLQFEMNTLKISSQDDKEKMTALDAKYKSETTKLKADLTNIRKQFEQQREQLANMQGIKLLKGTLEEELAIKEKAIVELQDKQDKLSEEIFKLSQRIDQMKWQSDQKIEAKDNEIIAMQEHLYSMNSKENMRLLRQNEQAEKCRQLQNEKKSLSRDLYQYKVRWQDSQEKNRQLMLEKKELDDFVRNPKRNGADINEKYDEVLKTFEREITELREENEELRDGHRNHTGM